MAGPKLARINAVIVEIFTRQRAGLVTDEPVFGDHARVPLHLQFHIAGDGEQSAGELVDQHLLRLDQCINIGGLAVAVLGQRLHGGIV